MSATVPSRDRRQVLLAAGATLNGIDYVEVGARQTRLYVHFLNPVPVTLSGPQPVTITGGETIPTVAVAPIAAATAFTTDSEDRPVLALSVAAPGDFSTYTLTIQSPQLDPFFAAAGFSFKAGCPTDLPCPDAATGAPPEPAGPAPAIDYLAKDFNSFKQALSDFSAARYPAWQERSEADLGIVLMEALAALADELSYYQDRVAAEASIVTATQRLSLLRHARLVDYEPAPATAATALLQLEVSAAGTVNTPLHVQALGPDGAPIDFEVGHGLADPASGEPAAIAYAVDPRWNHFRPGGASPPVPNLPAYWWDDSQVVLPAGSTELYLAAQGLGLSAGQQLLLDTVAPDSADPAVRELVTVASAAELTDPLLGTALTRLTLAAPTSASHDLSRTTAAGNLVPVVHGLRVTESFYIPGGDEPAPTEPGVLPAVVRTGANWTPEDPLPDYRYCLSTGPLAWIATPPGPDAADVSLPARPELVLTAQPASATPLAWQFVRWLLDAGPSAAAYTLTPERYSPVLSAGAATFYDYDGDDGTTIRFGDGTCGATPAAGTVFSVTYRVGGGAAGNVPADAIVTVPPGQAQSGLVTACTNPFAATGGAAAETAAQIVQRAPQRFASQLLSLVTPADYAAAAQSLAFVQQAGTTFRWTGSWLTALTIANPRGAEQPDAAQLESVTELLDRRRLAGYESYVLPPRYASIDLWLVLCADPSSFAAAVQAAVIAALVPGGAPGGRAGFFDHSRWGFGQPLALSALFAAVQACPGVAGILSASYRRRGAQLDWTALPETLTVAADQILRVDDDPSRPDAGLLTVTMEGGK